MLEESHHLDMSHILLTRAIHRLHKESFPCRYIWDIWTHKIFKWIECYMQNTYSISKKHNYETNDVKTWLWKKILTLYLIHLHEQLSLSHNKQDMETCDSPFQDLDLYCMWDKQNFHVPHNLRDIEHDVQRRVEKKGENQ